MSDSLPLVAESAPFDVTQFPYDWSDVAVALRISSGLRSSTFAERRVYNLDEGTTLRTVDIADAARIVRKVAGLEANP